MARKSETQKRKVKISRTQKDSPTSNSHLLANLALAKNPSLRRTRGAMDTWGCPSCTFENHSQIKACEVCMTAREENFFLPSIVVSGEGERSTARAPPLCPPNLHLPSKRSKPSDAAAAPPSNSLYPVFNRQPSGVAAASPGSPPRLWFPVFNQKLPQQLNTNSLSISDVFPESLRRPS